MSRIKDKRGFKVYEDDNDSDYRDEEEEITSERRHRDFQHPSGKKQKFQYDYGAYAAPIFNLPGNRVVFDNQSYTAKLLHTYCYKHGIPLALREGSYGFISVDRDVAIAANVFSAAAAVIAKGVDAEKGVVDNKNLAPFSYSSSFVLPKDSRTFHSLHPPVKIITTAKITI